MRQAADIAIVNASLGLPDKPNQACLLPFVGSSQRWLASSTAYSSCDLRLDDAVTESWWAPSVPCFRCQGWSRRHSRPRRIAGRTTRHHALNDLMWLTLGRANVFSVSERLISWVQTESIQIYWRRSHDTLSRIYLPVRHQTLGQRISASTI